MRKNENKTNKNKQQRRAIGAEQREIEFLEDEERTQSDAMASDHLSAQSLPSLQPVRAVQGQGCTELVNTCRPTPPTSV